MKRTIFLAAAVLGLAVVSCKKTDPVAPAEPGSCTISGTVQYDSNLANDTTTAGAFTAGLNPEDLTSGTLTFIVNSKDLDNDPDPTYAYQNLTFTAEVSAGEYTVTIPAINKPLSVEVYANEFNAAQRQYVAGDPDSFEEESKEFTYGPVTVSGIANGLTVVHNVKYNY